MDELKHGADFTDLEDHQLWHGLMFRWDAVLSEKERYQITHFIRELILKRTTLGNTKYRMKRTSINCPVGRKMTPGSRRLTGKSPWPRGWWMDPAGSNDYGIFLQHTVSAGKLKIRTPSPFRTPLKRRWS